MVFHIADYAESSCPLVTMRMDARLYNPGFQLLRDTFAGAQPNGRYSVYRANKWHQMIQTDGPLHSGKSEDGPAA